MRRSTLLFIFISLITLPCYVYSYCVYNKMEVGSGLYVHQDSGQAKFARNKERRFEHSHIPTNGKECCPYTNRQCSEKADKNNTCSFTLASSKSTYAGTERGLIYSTACPCGGYIVATGTPDKFAYKVYDADHNFVGEHKPHQ